MERALSVLGFHDRTSSGRIGRTLLQEMTRVSSVSDVVAQSLRRRTLCVRSGAQLSAKQSHRDGDSSVEKCVQVTCGRGARGEA